MASGPVLILILIAAIAFIIWSTAKLKLHPFLALLLTAYGVGLAAGMPITDIAATINKGFGNLMINIGLVIVCGTVIGVFLEKSGAAVVMADTILKWVGEKRPALAMSIIGYIVSIPVFCDSGFVILSSLNKALSRRSGISLVTLAVALSTGLYATHVMVPPTPGPLAAAGNLNANLGLVILIGMVATIPGIIAGYLWAKRFSNFKQAGTDDGKDPSLTWEEMKAQYGKLPSPVAAFMPLVLPIVLIGLASFANFPTEPLGSGVLKTALTFLGTPVTALLIGVGLCFFLVEKIDQRVLSDWIGAALKDAAVILVVTGAGGSLGAMLSATPISSYLGETLAQYNLGIFLPFIIAAALKTAQGSSTVSLVTTSAILAPMLGSLGFDSELGRVLMVLAIGAGAMVVSHANDSYFWVVSQFSNMEVATAYRAQTIGTLVEGVASIIGIAILAFILL
ncbi:MAG TPA: GntP family permease [Symbiobacteriaceae bacterium]